MVERCLAKADIAGSNPVSRSNTPTYVGVFLYRVGLRTRGFSITRAGRSHPVLLHCLGVCRDNFFLYDGIRTRVLRVVLEFQNYLTKHFVDVIISIHNGN